MGDFRNGLGIERCCDIVEREVARMVEVTTGVDPATPVPTCGEWTIADLLQHAGEVYRWAGMIVAQASPVRIPRDELDFGLPDRPEDLPPWFGAAVDEVVATFRAADPDTPMWAWGWPKEGRFWPRRMVHELTVHRADAELALGIEVAVDADVAADGVDELLDNLPQAAYFAPAVQELRGHGEVLGFLATDSGASWRITLEPERFTWARGPVEGAAATVEAPARDLLLGLYGRPACLGVAGDDELFDRWSRNSSI